MLTSLQNITDKMALGNCCFTLHYTNDISNSLWRCLNYIVVSINLRLLQNNAPVDSDIIQGRSRRQIGRNLRKILISKNSYFYIYADWIYESISNTFHQICTFISRVSLQAMKIITKDKKRKIKEPGMTFHLIFISSILEIVSLA